MFKWDDRWDRLRLCEWNHADLMAKDKSCTNSIPSITSLFSTAKGRIQSSYRDQQVLFMQFLMEFHKNNYILCQ